MLFKTRKKIIQSCADIKKSKQYGWWWSFLGLTHLADRENMHQERGTVDYMKQYTSRTSLWQRVSSHWRGLICWVSPSVCFNFRFPASAFFFDFCSILSPWWAQLALCPSNTSQEHLCLAGRMTDDQSPRLNSRSEIIISTAMNRSDNNIALEQTSLLIAALPKLLGSKSHYRASTKMDKIVEF